MILYVYHVLLQTYVAGRCLKTTHPRKRQLKRFCIHNVLCYILPLSDSRQKVIIIPIPIIGDGKGTNKIR